MPGLYRRFVAGQMPATARIIGAVEAGPTRFDTRKLPEVYDPSHPMAGDDGYYQGSNVDLVVEIADAKEASRSYEANLRVFEQSRQMGSSLLDLIRR